MKKEFYELKDLTVFLKENNITKYDKKVLCNYFKDKEGLQDESFCLISKSEAISHLVDEMKNETLCYFNTSFLTEYTDLDIQVINAIKSLEYKGNDALVKIFNDRLEEMAEDALQCDGVGHFYNYYDGSNVEIIFNNELHYFYFN